MGIGGSFYNIVKSMYGDVKYRVKIGGGLTNEIFSSIGVKQGCVLSPPFFNLFLADLPGIFDADCHPVSYADKLLSCIMYADDLVLLCPAH